VGGRTPPGRSLVSQAMENHALMRAVCGVLLYCARSTAVMGSASALRPPEATPPLTHQYCLPVTAVALLAVQC
jgi:hypothetical protein